MMNIIKYYLLIIFCWYVNAINGQSVKGVILDSEDHPIEFATLALFMGTDTTTVLTSAISKEDGSYCLNYNNVLEDSLILKISCIGYLNKTIHFFSSVSDLGIIKLTTKNYMTDDVVVTSHRRPFSFQEGILKIHVNALSNNKADKLIDIFKRLPGVVVSSDNIVVGGSNPIIIIDGIKQRVPISHLITYLSSISAHQIESISINTTQLAENKIGSEEVTIVVETKKNGLDGYQLTNSSYGQLFRKSSFKFGNYIDGILKYKNFSGNISLGVNKRSLYGQNEEITENRRYFSGNRQKKEAFFGLLNFTWMPKAIRGAFNVYSSYYKDYVCNEKEENYFFNKESKKIAERNNKDTPDLLSLNIEYVSNDSLKNRFKIAYGLLRGKSDFSEIYQNNLNETNNQRKTISGHQHIFEAQYTYGLSPFELKIGTQAYLSKLYENEKEKTFFSDYRLTENIVSLYSSFQWKITKNISMYAGLRYEQTFYKYHMSSFLYKDDNGNLSPSFTFNWKISDEYSTSLKFSSQNSRPNFYNLLPGKSYLSDEEYQQGNLDFIPTRTYRVRWENLLFGYISLNTSVTWLKDYWGSVYGINENGVRYSTYDNLSDYVSFYANLSTPFSFLSNKLRGSLNISGMYSKFYNVKETIYINKVKSWYSVGSLYFGYEITPRFSFYVYPYYYTDIIRLQKSRKGRCSMDAGLQYCFLKDKSLVLAITTEDIFNNESVKSVTYYGSQAVSYDAHPSTQNIMITLSYTLSRNSKSIKIRRNENNTERFTK